MLQSSRTFVQTCLRRERFASPCPTTTFVMTAVLQGGLARPMLLGSGVTENDPNGLEGGAAMSQRQANLLHLRDTLESLTQTRQQLEWATDAEASGTLTESMLRDLERCRRLCESLRPRT